MTLADLPARIQRLGDLGQGLAKEVLLWKAGNDPLLFTERQAYLRAIQDTLAGIEAARVTLSQAEERLRKPDA